jgi:conjugative relaxase-like TrwC/TraI family protein
MLSPKTQYRLANPKEYFEDHLCAGDYYSEGQSIAGQWFGKGAESLQITGTVRRDEFLRLCDNLDPRTGNRLTQRLKTTRTVVGDAGDVREMANCRVFYDFTFSPPKSVWIAALVGRDSRIVEAHNRAVVAALGQGRYQPAAMVRDDFAGAQGHPDFHQRQGATAGEHPPVR